MTPHRELRDRLAAVAAGDRSACARVYALSCPKLYGVALRLVRRPEPAMAALRRAYGRIFRDAATLAEEHSVLGAMAVITRAAALDTLRTEGGPDAFEPFHIARPAEDPLALPGRSKPLTRILGALGSLSEERRRMVLLAYYDGWSREALGVYFDTPQAGVRAWLARSILELSSQLGRRS